MRWWSFCKANDYFLKVFAVSKKVHTTRSRALGVLTEDDTQIVRAFSCLLSMSVITNNAIQKPNFKTCVLFCRFYWTLLVSPLYQRSKGAFLFLFSSFFL